MKTQNQNYRCAVIGDWHLAFSTAACLASLGHKTLLVNAHLQSQSDWKDFPTLELNEPGLPELIAECRSAGNLQYSNGMDEGWTADFVWMAVDTPVNERDEVDLSPLSRVIRDLGQFKNCSGPFVMSSQIPVGFSKSIESQFSQGVVYVPENLRLGKGIETFKFADRTVIGSNSVQAREAVKDLMKGFQTEFLLCDAVTAEMIKHATNAFLATSISFANEMAQIGDLLGADNWVVGQALKMDKRIGKGAYVIPGLGFAGGTLPRDLRVLQKVGLELAKTYSVATPLTDAVLAVNESTARALVSSIQACFGGESLQGKRVCILGYTYKADTDTLRRSPSVELAEALRKTGVEVHGFDPMMNERDLSSLAELLQHHSTWSEVASTQMDAFVVMTGRKIFADLKWSNLQKTCAVLDTQNAVSRDAILNAGLSYKGLWRPLVQPRTKSSFQDTTG